jgi:nicotinic acid mononucleotide adenylyltransferase
MQPQAGTSREGARRYRAAWHLLQSAARMMAIERGVAGLDVSGAPAMRAFARVGALTHATRIGLFPGSFNPLTDAHVAVADAARAQAQLDTLAWAMAAVTVDKERVARSSLLDRLAQLVAFAHPRGEAVLLLNRGLYVDQVAILRAAVGSLVRVFVVVGFDKVVQIFDPRYYADRNAALDALFATADLLVAPRAGAGAEQVAALLGKRENRAYAHHVTPLDVPTAHRDDSSTEVRALAADPQAHRDQPGDQLAQLVPPEALALIATGAYAAMDRTDHTDRADRYPLRQAWLSVLPALPPALLRRLPPIGELVARTSESAELRRGLATIAADPAEETVASVRELLAGLGIVPSAGA